MTYADLLRKRFPQLEPRVDDLFLLEAHQVAELPVRAPTRELGAVLHAHPRVRRFLTARYPPIEAYVVQLLAEHDPVADADLARAETSLLWEIADWIVYQRAPHLYDEASEYDPDLSAITDVVDLEGKVVIDAGAGTGQLAIAVAATARHVFAVEPVATLRRYIQDRAADAGIDNLYVVDGLLSAIPLPPSTADVLLTRQAIGWNLADELPEIERVLRPGGVALHLVGPLHPRPPDDHLRQQLLVDGYQPGTYREGAIEKRRFWKRFGSDA